jgi:rhodanese-related sulfurtransferase
MLVGRDNKNSKKAWLLSLLVVVPVLAVAAGWSVISAHRAEPLLVPAVSADKVLEYIRDGRKVIFIDARENAEYAETHIPGAINLSLRDLEELGPKARELLQDPDLVVAYCLKDFRGYEVARALQGIEVRDAVTLSEQGINGWKKRGLPVDGAGGADDQESKRKLLACASAPQSCKAPS